MQAGAEVLLPWKAREWLSCLLCPVCLLLSGFPSEFTSRQLEEEGQNDDRIVAGFSFPFSPEKEPFRVDEGKWGGVR